MKIDIKKFTEAINAKLKAAKVEFAIETKPTRVACSATGTAADGSMIETPTAFEIGAEVYTNDVDGNQIPLMDGEYVIDGTTSIVVSAGLITEVSMVQEEATDVEMAAAIETAVEPLVNQIATLEGQAVAQSATITELTTERDNLKKSLDELQVKFSALSKKAAAPSVKEVAQSAQKTTPSPSAKPFHKMTYEERILSNLSK